MNLITKVRTQGQVVKMVVILVEEEKMREMLVVVPWVVVMFFGYDIRRALKKSPFFMTKTENAYDL